MYLPFDQAISLLGIYPKEIKVYSLYMTFKSKKWEIPQMSHIR